MSYCRRIAMVYHSQTQKVASMAGAVAQGVQAEDVEFKMLKAFDAGLDDLLWCDGLIIGSPENFGYMAGAIKDFFDRTYYPAQEHQINIPYVLFIGAGNDGSGASREIQRIAKAYPMRLVAEPLICNSHLDKARLQHCKEFGQAFAAGLTLGIFGS